MVITTNTVAIARRDEARIGTGDPLRHAIGYRHEPHERSPERSDKIATTHDLTTNQGIFDHVASSLLLQGGKAPDSISLENRELLTGDGLTCVYRSKGRSSPIGVLITDEAYDDDLELLHLYSRDPSGGHPLIDALDPRISRDPETIRMIWMLQMAHDNPRNGFGPRLWLDDWRHVMGQRAGTWGLDPSCLEAPCHRRPR